MSLLLSADLGDRLLHYYFGRLDLQELPIKCACPMDVLIFEE
jgi:hypothetical protein